MTCTRCENSGFLNLHQVPEALRDNIKAVKSWITANPSSDVSVCDCCGNGENWHGVPGEHFQGGDRSGKHGPYAYNGGLPECY